MSELDRSRVNHHATRRVVRQDGKLFCHTHFDDDHALERNKQIRNAGLIDRAKLQLHEGEDIRMVISCPDALQWTYFKRDYPDIYKDLNSRVEAERVSACRRLQILHPEWVVQERL